MTTPHFRIKQQEWGKGVLRMEKLVVKMWVVFLQKISEGRWALIGSKNASEKSGNINQVDEKGARGGRKAWPEEKGAC